jgi:CheY-like chemotaxis protein
MDTDRYNWISRRAHEIWQQEGFPSGRDREHWSQAVAEREQLECEEASASDLTEGQWDEIKSVLVVDDEPIIRFAAVDVLEHAGFEVWEAANADEALVLLNRRTIDAVFTDINMSGSMDGLGLVSRIRALSPKTRVVVTSGHVGFGSFDLASGVSFLPKPYQFEALINLLSTPAPKAN